ncbi:putative uncharacterized protein [Candidatus Colimorpha enterica]|uniref:Glutamate synthase (NADH) small subunit n=1 Tax=Candidatus Colimorpha enterica TaxID=3083063 RepID=R6TVZ5_9BACT|nr:putative uncharacterized protein [Candidatus Colimorpha enterica]
MGKPTGFMEYGRRNNLTAPPLERIKSFDEFHPRLSQEEREKQGARCMNCGIPFCQSAMKLNGAVSGCPLHNLIPEWNDEIFRKNPEQALARLLKTSSFPEFTGRVCPALCEAACSCGLYGDPFTIRDNELYIIENGFEKGLIKPRIPEIRSGKRVAVVGSGPSGLACADMLNRRGHSVTVFESSDRPGGLLMYGIPNMKLDKKIVLRRIKLMEDEGVGFVTGCRVDGEKAKELTSEYDAVVLCCGSGTPRDLKVEGRDADGVYFAVDFLKSTTKALLDGGLEDGNHISAKGKDVIIVGGGDTGNDCVGTCIRHGCRSVIQLEMMPKLPDTRSENNPWPQWPRVCKTDYGQEEAIALFGSDPRIYQTTVKKLISGEGGRLSAVITVSLEAARDEATGRTVMKEIPGTEKTHDCGLLIIAAGFTGASESVCTAFGLERDARGNLPASEGNHRTSVPKVFTAGDMRRGQSLVVWAVSEGREAAAEVDSFLMGYTDLI